MTLLLLFNQGAAVAAGSAFDFFGSDAPRPEFAYLGLERSDNDSGTADPLASFRVASKELAGAAGGRVGDYLAIVNGHLYLEEGGSWSQLTDSNTRLDPAATYFPTTVLGGKLYYTDGKNYRVYDPAAGTVSVWVADAAGKLPESCSLLTAYGGRIALANRTEWHLSAINAPGNFDYNPPTVTAAQAVAGVAAEAFQVPALINALLAYQDDYLFFGCDQGLYRLTGNPWKGGEIDKVSDSVGVAFGDTMVTGTNGTLFFFATEGGVYRMAGPMAQPLCLTDAVDGQDVSIQQRVAGIDLGTYRVALQWDYDRRGLKVLQIPYDNDTITIPRSWFWEEKSNAWWEDEVSNVALLPYCVATLNGDAPDDRALVVGCQDGYVRAADDDAADDDGYAVESRVTLGPIAAGDDFEILLRRIRAVMADGMAGVAWQVYSSESPSELGSLRASGEFGPGLSLRLPVSVRGPYLKIRLQNLKVAQRWALEELRAELMPMGSRRAM